jgi:hypothetical protein
MSPLEKPADYRKRANELRVVAADAGQARNRDTLICFADDLDELAEEAELAERGRISEAAC